MKNRPHYKIYSLIAMCLVTLTTFTVAFTAAAFAAAERHIHEVTVDLGYKKYFGSGTIIDSTTQQEVPASSGDVVSKSKDGHDIRRYYINNSEHLRNLSYLVNIGVFSRYDEFEVTNDFQYTGEALTPIGNDQFPFKSNFFGKDVTTPTDRKKAVIISNLNVIGKNLGDVGMFGYIANEGSISNFILDTPHVTSTFIENSNGTLIGDDYDREKIDSNPLRSVTNLDGTALAFSPTVCESLNIVSAAKETDLVIDKFKIDPSNINLNYLIEENEPAQAELFVNISKPQLVTYNKTDFTFTANNIPDTEVPSFANGKKMEGEYFTIEYLIKGIAKVGDSYRYSSMVLERFKVYYDYKAKAFNCDSNDFKCFDKTIYPDVYYEEKENLNEDETLDPTVNLVQYDDIRGLYVGVVAGRLEGIADKVGVYMPTLDINRPFISKSLLIGKAIDDNNKRTLSIERFDATEDLKQIADNKLTYAYVPFNLKNYLVGKNQNTKVRNADRDLGNRFVTDIYTHQIANTNQYTTGMSPEAENIIRIYTNRQYLKDNKNGPNFDNNTRKYPETAIYSNFNNLDFNGTRIEKTGAVGLNKPMNVKFTTYHQGENVQGALIDEDKGFRNLIMENCIQFWVSAKHNRSRINAFNNGTLEFYLNIEMDYLYFDDNPTPKSEFEFRVAQKALRRRRILYPGYKLPKVSGNPYKSTINYTVPNNVNPSTIIADPVNGLDLEILGDKTTRPTARPLDNRYGFSSYPFSYLETKKDENGNDITGLDNLKINASDRSGSLSDKGNGNFKVKTKTFSIVANTDYVAKEGDLRDRIPMGFFPSFYLGIKNTEAEPKFELDVLGLRVTLSNKRGNAESSTGTVDFIKRSDKNGLELPIGPRGWLSTGVKVAVETIQNYSDLKEKPAPGSKLPHFATTFSEALDSNKKHINYHIEAQRLEYNKVKVSYTPGTIMTALKSIYCYNTDGYKEAEIVNTNLPISN